MFRLNIKRLTIFALVITTFSNILFSAEPKVVMGEAALSERDAKRFSKFGKKTNFKDFDATFTYAERNVFQNALLKEYNTLLSEDDRDAFMNQLKNDIFPVAEGYIVSSDYMSEEVKDPGVLILRYQVVVDLEKFKNALKDIGVSFDIKTRKSVMLLIDEYFKPDQIPSNKGGLKKEVIKTEELELKVKDVETAEGSRSEKLSDTDESFKSDDKYNAEFEMDKKRKRTKIVREFFPPDLSGFKIEQSACGAEIQKYLIGKDVRVLDKEYTDKIRGEFLGKDGFLADFMQDEGKVADLARKVSEEANADIVVVGCVNIIYNGLDDGTHKSTANLIVKMVDATTGDIAASTTGSESGVGNSGKTSAQRSATRLGQILGNELTDGIVEYIKKREAKGYEYTIFLNGISSTRSKVRFIKVLKTLESSVETFERRFDRENQFLEIVVQYKGSIDEFKESFYEQIYEYDEFGGLEEEQSKGGTIFMKLYE